MQFGVIGTSFTIYFCCLCACTQRSTLVVFLKSHLPDFFKQSHSLVPGLGWLAKELLRSACLYFPCAGTTSLTPYFLSL